MKKMKFEEMNKEFALYVIMVTLTFCKFTNVFELGIFYSIIIMILVMLYLSVIKMISSVMFKIIRYVYREKIESKLSNIKKVKKEIEKEDYLKYEKNNKQRKIENIR